MMRRLPTIAPPRVPPARAGGAIVVSRPAED